MATGLYFGVSGKARKVNGMYIGVAGKARKVVKAYLGVDGKARLIWDKPFVPPDSFTAEMYMRYMKSGSPENTVTQNMTFRKVSDGQYQASCSTDYWGYIYDLWVTVPGDIAGHVDPTPENTYATLINGSSGKWNSSYYQGTIYFIEDGNVQYLSGNEIQFTIALQ